MDKIDNYTSSSINTNEEMEKYFPEKSCICEEKYNFPTVFENLCPRCSFFALQQEEFEYYEDIFYELEAADWRMF